MRCGDTLLRKVDLTQYGWRNPNHKIKRWQFGVMKKQNNNNTNASIYQVAMGRMGLERLQRKKEKCLAFLLIIRQLQTDISRIKKIGIKMTNGQNKYCRSFLYGSICVSACACASAFACAYVGDVCMRCHKMWVLNTVRLIRHSAAIKSNIFVQNGPQFLVALLDHVCNEYTGLVSCLKARNETH